MYFIEVHSPGDSGDTKLGAQKPELLSKIRIACQIQRAEYGSPMSDGSAQAVEVPEVGTRS